MIKEGELKEESVRKESLRTAADGKNYRTKIYNLDVIISVGYRVKSVSHIAAQCLNMSYSSAIYCNEVAIFY